MRSNDNILLEKAYEQIFNNQFLKESDDSKFKLQINSYLAKALGDEVYSLPRENFYDAIEKNNLKENSWYVYSRKDGTSAHLLKVTTIEDGKISVEDEQTISNVEEYLQGIVKRDMAMSSYFSDRPDAPLD